MRAVAAQIARRARQLDAIHADCTLVEINLQHPPDVVIQRAESFHEIGQGRVAKAGAGFTVRHLGIHLHRFTTQAGQKAHDVRRIAAVAQQPVRHGNRARIDERVAWDATLGLQLHQRIERAARGFATDSVPQPLTQASYRQREREHLGNALDRKRRGAVPCRRLAPITGAQCNSEMAGRNASKRGNVTGDLAFHAEQGFDLRSDVVEDGLKIHANGSATLRVEARIRDGGLQTTVCHLNDRHRF